MIVQLASVVGVAGEVEDKVGRGMFLIKKCPYGCDTVLVEGIVMRVGHDWREIEEGGGRGMEGEREREREMAGVREMYIAREKG